MDIYLFDIIEESNPTSRIRVSQKHHSSSGLIIVQTYLYIWNGHVLIPCLNFPLRTHTVNMDKDGVAWMFVGPVPSLALWFKRKKLKLEKSSSKANVIFSSSFHGILRLKPPSPNPTLPINQPTNQGHVSPHPLSTCRNKPIFLWPCTAHPSVIVELILAREIKAGL